MPHPPPPPCRNSFFLGFCEGIRKEHDGKIPEYESVDLSLRRSSIRSGAGGAVLSAVCASLHTGGDALVCIDRRRR